MTGWESIIRRCIQVTIIYMNSEIPSHVKKITAVETKENIILDPSQNFKQVLLVLL